MFIERGRENLWTRWIDERHFLSSLYRNAVNMDNMDIMTCTRHLERSVEGHVEHARLAAPVLLADPRLVGRQQAVRCTGHNLELDIDTSIAVLHGINDALVAENIDTGDDNVQGAVVGDRVGKEGRDVVVGEVGGTVREGF